MDPTPLAGGRCSEVWQFHRWSADSPTVVFPMGSTSDAVVPIPNASPAADRLASADPLRSVLLESGVSRNPSDLKRWFPPGTT